MASPGDRLRRSALFRALKRRLDHPVYSQVWLRARAVIHYAGHGHVSRQIRLRRYLASTVSPRLQVGSGQVRLPGWLNSDILWGNFYLDISRPLPLPDATFTHAFGEHVIEHITERAGVQLLRELYRVLRPGGVVRITTPDLRKIIAIYEDRNPAITREEYARFLDNMTGKRHERACQIFNDYMRLWGHLHVYDEEDLAAKMRQVGFERVARFEPGQSDHDALKGLEHHGLPWQNDAEAMCLEGTKPAQAPREGIPN
jgi:predicted SAM-dependent methyltransferase